MKVANSSFSVAKFRMHSRGKRRVNQFLNDEKQNVKNKILSSKTDNETYVLRCVPFEKTTVYSCCARGHTIYVI